MIRTYIVTVHHDGETPETFDEIVFDELTNPLSTFIANWSAPANPAWGRRDGYEGPFIVGVIVHAVRPVGGRYTCFPTPFWGEMKPRPPVLPAPLLALMHRAAGIIGGHP